MTWPQRLHLWSAVAVCAVLVPRCFAAYLIYRYLRGIARDAIHWHRRMACRR